MSGAGLDDILDWYGALSDEEKASIEADALAATKELVWVPNPGPQTDAYWCEADELFYGGQAGGGKLICINELLPTPAGWVRMGDISVGDRIFDDKGQVARVTVVSPIKVAKTYDLTFDDGSTITCCADHLWLTYDARELESLFRQTPEWRAKRRKGRHSRATGNKSAAFQASIAARNAARGEAIAHSPSQGTVRTTQQIVDTLLTKRGRRNHAVPVAQAIQTAEADLPLDPYTLGAWLGDGDSNGGGLTGVDREIWERIEAAGFTVTHSPAEAKRHYIKGLTARLRACGVLNNKHVPPIYLRASEDQRLALLQGLMDTDGHAALDGGSEFDNTNRRLIEAVYELVCSLGIKATITEGVAKLYGRITGPRWRVKFTTDKPVFYLPRKAARLPSKVRGTARFRYIVDAIEVDPIPMRCIAVDSPSRLYLAGRSFIPTHNTDLIAGLAITDHERSLILRRQNTDTTAIVERLEAILGTRDGLNNSTPKQWRLPGRLIDIGGCLREDDKQKYKGKPHDLIGFDEVSDFTESQYRFIIAWNRSTKPGQRCRVVAAGNPPTTPEGYWVIKHWGPWLDPTHPRPAKPGELRWFTTIDGRDVECDGPAPIEVDGEMVYPRSRTFIRSTLSDNPDLEATGYDSNLAALPEELRNAYRDGRFDKAMPDKPHQLIATAHIQAAMDRWSPDGGQGLPMTCLSHDVALGGTNSDGNAWARRHGLWFDEVIKEVSKVKLDPIELAARDVELMRNGCDIVIDMGGGYGSGVYSHLRANVQGITIHAHDGAAASAKRSRDGKLKFANKRAEVHWKFREALEPGLGVPVQLPPDPELKADLAALTWKMTPRGIVIIDKETLRTQLGRSPDKGDCVVNGWNYGEPAVETDFRARQLQRSRGAPRVNIGHASLKSRWRR